MIVKKIIATFAVTSFIIMSVPVASATVTAVDATGGTVSFSVAANGYPENPTKMLPNVYITMYYVRPVRAGVYDGTYGATVKTGANGEGAIFQVEPGQIVNFVSFKGEWEANNTRHYTFTSPPYKNFFSPQDNNDKQLCQINYLDQDTKMRIQIDNSYSCAMSMSTPLSSVYVAAEAGTYLGNDASFNPQFGDFEVWIQKTNDPLTLVRNATVKLYDASTYQLIGQTSSGTRGIVTFITKRERKFYFIGTEGGITYGGYKTQYNDNPRVFYVTSDGEYLKNAFDNSTTSVMRLGGYPNSFTEGFQPTTTPTPTPATPTTTPTLTCVSGNSLGEDGYYNVCAGNKVTHQPSRLVATVLSYDDSKLVLSISGMPGNNTTALTVYKNSTSSVGGNNGYEVTYKYTGISPAATGAEIVITSRVLTLPVTPTPTTPTPVLEIPSIATPVQNQTLTNYPRQAMISWSYVANAMNYEVAIECDYCGDSLWSSKYPISLVSTTYLTTQPLAGDNQFRVRVRGVAGDGTRGLWSDFRYFTYNTATTTPSLPTPRPYTGPARPYTGPARPYTGPARPYSAPIVATVNLDYKYYKNGLSGTTEKGSILLTLSSDYSRRGYIFKDNKYTSVSRGPFYVSDSNEERIPKFYGNNIGQEGLVDLGERSLDSVTSPLETSNRYYRFGTDIYLHHTYAAYDSINNKYVLIYVTSVTGFNPKIAPVESPVSVEMPTESYDTSDENLDDFIEEGDADMQLINATITYGKRPRAGVKGFQFKITTNNTSEDIQRFPLEARCDVSTGNVNYSLVSILKKYDQKPGKKTFSFIQNLSSKGSALIDSLKKEAGSVKCSVAIVGLVDFATGLTTVDSDTSNNAVELELRWKAGKLRTNNFKRRSM